MIDKTPTGRSVAPHMSGQLNVAKAAMNDVPNLGSFQGVRTTTTSAKEGRLKVDASAKKGRKAVLKKAISKYK